MSVDETPEPRLDLGGILAVAATYIYFLLYAQFGFIGRLEQLYAKPLIVEHAMGLMGAGGLLASFATAWLLGRQSPRRLLRVGFAGSAVTALMTLTGTGVALHYTAAFLIGAFTGLSTVTLAASLRVFIRGPAFALRVGVGTGLAYLTCNIPAVFGGSPTLQTCVAAAACGIGLAAIGRQPPPGAASSPGVDTGGLSPAPFSGAAFIAPVCVLFALVFLDSTVFATIQHTPALKTFTWGSPAMKLTLGFVHAAAAVAAGWMIDRGRFRRLLALTFALFALAFMWLQGGGVAAWASGPLYAAGISLYSVALVVLPSLHGEAPGLLPVRWRAAWLYAVAGWIASAFGVGLALHLHTIPGVLVLGTGMLVLGGLLFPLTPARLRLMRDYRLLTPFVVLAVVVYSGFFRLPTPPPSADPAAGIARGRQVYIQEGCINCHSQYVRPRTPDVLIWGPARDVDPTETPPLLGNRRQGPDLMNVGLRRGALWQRQHLMAPDSVSPGSRMPSYAGLFGEGDSRGDDLVAYLGSLGAAHGPERAATVAAWTPAPGNHVPSPAAGEELFRARCAVCHGAEARGDGPVAEIFQQPLMNLRKGPFVFIPQGLNAIEEALALARVVKFGIAGLNMPGHETLSDADILDLVSYIRPLGREGNP